MLGLHSFGVPQFSIPQMPQTERPLHKLKDFMSFLNSLQWKADDDTKPEDKGGEQTRDVKFDKSEVLDGRRIAEEFIAGLDPSLHSGYDILTPIGSTRWDGMDDKQLWEEAMKFTLTGENPITKGYGDTLGMTPNDVDYNVFNKEEADKMAPEKRWTGYDPYHKLEAIRASVPGFDPSLMAKVGW